MSGSRIVCCVIHFGQTFYGVNYIHNAYCLIIRLIKSIDVRPSYKAEFRLVILVGAYARRV